MLRKVRARGALVGSLLGRTAALAASHRAPRRRKVDWSASNGPFGKFDQAQLQRGYKVYREVCSACHAMSLVSFRNLGDKGGPFYDAKYPNPNDNPYVKAIAAEYPGQRHRLGNRRRRSSVRPPRPTGSRRPSRTRPRPGPATAAPCRRICRSSPRPVAGGRGLHLLSADRLPGPARRPDRRSGPALQPLLRRATCRRPGGAIPSTVPHGGLIGHGPACCRKAWSPSTTAPGRPLDQQAKRRRRLPDVGRRAQARRSAIRWASP